MAKMNKHVHLFIVYFLCVFYSIITLIGLAYLLLTKYSKKFWIVKDRPIPPKCLTDQKFGEHKYIKANGLKFHYVEKGDQSKPLILFVHGFPEFWYSWRFQLKELSKDYWCVAIDMRGYGDTDKPEGVKNYHIDNLADDIKAIVDALGRKKFNLVAHDWGAVVGFHYVLRYMDTLEKYICIGAPPSAVWKNSVLSEWNQFKKSWYIFFFQAPYLPEFMVRLFDLKAFKAMGNNEFTDTFTEEDLEAYKYTFSKPGALTPPINYYRNVSGLKRKLKIPDEFAPGLFLLGEKDLYISKSSGEEAKKFYKNLEFNIVTGANHFAQQDKPEAVNKMILEFLERK